MIEQISAGSIVGTMAGICAAIEHSSLELLVYSAAVGALGGAAAAVYSREQAKYERQLARHPLRTDLRPGYQPVGRPLPPGPE
jgi:hypothetical protein